MFTAIRHFVNTWSHESGQTARVLGAITDRSLATRAAPGQRTLGELAWHIVVSPRVILGKVGIRFEAPDRAEPAPASAEEILAVHGRVAPAAARAVAAAWTDDMLPEKVAFYGTSVPRGVALAVTLHHEIHHRGQLTVLMRLAGLAVPGVYGASADDAA